MALTRVEISDTKALNPGDRIEMHFKTSGMVWLQATQIALIEYRLSGRKDFEIISNSLPEKNRVIFTIEIKQPPKEEPELQRAGVGLTAVVIAGAFIAASGVFYLTLVGVYKIGEKALSSPVGKIAVAGTGVGIAAAGIAALLLIFLPKK